MARNTNEGIGVDADALSSNTNEGRSNSSAGSVGSNMTDDERMLPVIIWYGDKHCVEDRPVAWLKLFEALPYTRFGSEMVLEMFRAQLENMWGGAVLKYPSGVSNVFFFADEEAEMAFLKEMLPVVRDAHLIGLSVVAKSIDASLRHVSNYSRTK